ncbi:MAG TPA: phosphoadenylyl-sulfate reductase [Candidatus Hydrogenedentes bacterium]|nr:phosphoadenylyl-sulfate reductase [Candidatus Hydrogenedentota bacterium]HOK88675.1 phosphoadenylyl-sulfate reductase [Candidatus Hydrogenedentota bacterium]
MMRTDSGTEVVAAPHVHPDRTPLGELINLGQLEQMSPEQMLRWAWEHYGDRAGIITSFQDTGCVLIDMMSRHAPGMRVITIDTLRLHPETLEHIERMRERYRVRLERFTPDPDAVERMVRQHGEYLFFDSKAKQEYCCAVRKVEPNRRALASLDVWFTGLRRDQSAFRAGTPRAQWVVIDGRSILKLAPLADWPESRVLAYLEERGVPRNPLMEKGYKSIGCVICTTPVLPHEPARAGRWRWFNALESGDKKECGIHIHGSGI